MNIKRTLCVTCLAILIPGGSAFAGDSGLSWSYLQGWYSDSETDVDSDSFSSDGFGLEGLYKLNPDWFAIAGWSSETAEESGAELTLDYAQLGVGRHWQLGRKSDLYAGAGLLMADFELDLGSFGNFSDDDTGYFGMLGIRGKVSSSIELDARATYVDVFEESDTELLLTGLYHFGRNWSGLLGYRSADDTDGFRAGIRYSF